MTKKSYCYNTIIEMILYRNISIFEENKKMSAQSHVRCTLSSRPASDGCTRVRTGAESRVRARLIDRDAGARGRPCARTDTPCKRASRQQILIQSPLMLCVSRFFPTQSLHFAQSSLSVFVKHARDRRVQSTEK